MLNNGLFNKIAGLVLVLSAGLLFTVERAMAKAEWVLPVMAVKMSPSGDYPSDWSPPSLVDNPFVIGFLLVGIAFFVVGVSQDIRRSVSPESAQTRGRF